MSQAAKGAEGQMMLKQIQIRDFSQMYVDDGGYDNVVNSNLFFPECHLGRTLLILSILLIQLIFISNIKYISNIIYFFTRVPLGGLCDRGGTRTSSFCFSPPLRPADLPKVRTFMVFLMMTKMTMMMMMLKKTNKRVPPGSSSTQGGYHGVCVYDKDADR